MTGVMMCEEIEEQPRWGGSIDGHSYKPRSIEIAHETLMNNYFNSNSVYTEKEIRRCFPDEVSCL